ncbi:hypothetical protein SAMN05444377_10482 [Flavobacterium fontis]|uniref:Viral coat protein P2 N-terminal domain-containing protein n=1 Tax=Flavobacterium fontis TaxID=1124188 RepID=A0A1M4Z7G1_9FLAO|nr:hypothetical protein [Flavobacterium fontis]SHF13935.1 hypothetical protein SAMN05444377_10470 [Flavobacterium fontis]SHF14300.1 hypothetical protein SAMN05444377_10482 [Flavobacterium fontis]
MLLKRVSGTSKDKIVTQTELSKLVLLTNMTFNGLQDEKIQITIERNGGKSISVHPKPVNLRQYILASTYGQNAICAFPTAHYSGHNMSVVLDLTVAGNVELVDSDKIVVELSNLNEDPDIYYEFRGIQSEDGNGDDSDIYIFEPKVIPDYEENFNLNVDKYDVCVIPDLNTIREINFTHALTRQVTKRDPICLRAEHIDFDPVGIVYQNGNVRTSDPNFLQLDTDELININVVKELTAGQNIDVLFRKSVSQAQLGLK